MDKFFLTTAIDYVNGKPHIGHAYEKIAADVIFRHFTQNVDDCFFLTGTDEHGIKIQKTAASRGITPKELCDENANAFKACWEEINMEYSKFIRTTDDYHVKSVQRIFKRLLDKGDIYKHSYTGLYCSGCEAFLSEKDLTEDGLCPDHLKKPEIVTEENYFFRLTKYKEQIANYIKTHPNFIMPSFRANEVLNQLDNIEDISVSRSKNSVQWGIPVPGDDEQVIYVWIDALSNYITALGYESDDDSMFKKYWPAVHVIGKDILKFHAIYWPAILLALGEELPETIFAHGWITVGETKMSKSLGNVIAPADVLKAFNLDNADALRYYLVTSAACGKDGNYSDDDFKEKVNADLANNIGNLLNRTLNMFVKYFDGKINPEFIEDNNEIFEKGEKTLKEVHERFLNFELAEGAKVITEYADFVNKYVSDNAPWTLAKEGKMTECGKVLYNVVEASRLIGIMLYPYCPIISEAIFEQLNTEFNVKYEGAMARKLQPGILTEKDKIKPVFPRIDSEFATDKKVVNKK